MLIKGYVKKTAALLILGSMLAVFPGYGYAAEKSPRIYTFVEVGLIAQTNSGDVIRQKSALEQAEINKESQLTNWQSQAYNYYADPNSQISESSLYSLQDSYESALSSYQDAEESYKKLIPKVAYQAQKLYLDILQAELQIELQKMEILRLQDEHELAKVKTAFGSFTQTQLRNAKTQWESAQDTLDSLLTTLRTNKNTMRGYLNIADDVDFGLENPPVIGNYPKEFDEREVLTDALRNSMSLKQAQREVEDLSKKVQQYQNQGEYDQARRLAASSASKDLALKETRQTLTRTVESAMKEFNGLEEALEKARENLNVSKKALVTTRLKQNVGAATVNELRQAERAVLNGEKELLQAQYNCYLVANKVALMKDGVLVS